MNKSWIVRERLSLKSAVTISRNQQRTNAASMTHFPNTFSFSTRFIYFFSQPYCTTTLLYSSYLTDCIVSCMRLLSCRPFALLMECDQNRGFAENRRLEKFTYGEIQIVEFYGRSWYMTSLSIMIFFVTYKLESRHAYLGMLHFVL